MWKGRSQYHSACAAATGHRARWLQFTRPVRRVAGRSSALVISSVAALLLLSGCKLALRPYNMPSQQKLHLQTATPTNYVVRVADTNRFPVPNDGRVTFDVPRLQRGCDAYLFGLIKIKDGSPETIPAIHVLRGEQVVRKLSLQKLGNLPVDSEGYHILVLR